MAYLRKLESGRWQAAIRKRGHPSTSKTFRTKAAAETWARGRENEIERGEALETVPANQWTIKMLLDWYGDISEHKKGWKKERSRYRILIHWLGKRTLATLSVDDLRRYAKDRGVKSDTIRRDLSVLSAAIEAARTLKNVALRENVSMKAARVLTSTRVLTKPVRRDRRTAQGELGALFGQLPMVMSRVVGFALETAMRRGEIAKIRKEDINGNTIKISDDKSGKTTIIPISAAAVEILEMGPLWEMKPDSITQAFKRACKRAGIVDLRPHDLRHEATSRLFEKGLTIEEVASITRHSDWRSLKIYTHPSRDHIAKKLS